MYAIIRAEKTKRTGIAGKNSHNMRLRETPNADPKRKELNEVLIGTGDLKTDLQNRIDETNAFIRNKETVVSTELILTASPEFFEKNDPKKNREWVDEQVNFLKSEYGDNCINAVLHLDETTPHIHAFITPIVENEKNNRLEFNNKSYFGVGGYKTLQNKYFSHNSKFGLKRGVEKNNTSADHKIVKEFYGDINTDAKKEAVNNKKIVIEDFQPAQEKNFLGMTKEKPITKEDVKTHTEKAVKRYRRANRKLKALNNELTRENEKLTEQAVKTDSRHEHDAERKFIGKIQELEGLNQSKQNELNKANRSLKDANSRIGKLEEFKETVEEKILKPVKKYFEKEFTALVQMAQKKEFEDKVSESFETNKQEFEPEPSKKRNNLPSFKPNPMNKSEG
ncbi:MobV family relaxase [Escherichia coli]